MAETKLTLTDTLKKDIEALYPLYEERLCTLMPALYLVQDAFGYISDEVAQELSHFMDIPMVQVEEVLSFYTMYHRKPVGKYHFQVCTNITCCMFQAREIKDRLKELIGVTEPKELSKDGKFSYEEVACLGSCGTAPVVMINHDYHEDFSIEEADAFIKKARSSQS